MDYSDNEGIGNDNENEKDNDNFTDNECSNNIIDSTLVNILLVTIKVSDKYVFLNSSLQVNNWFVFLNFCRLLFQWAIAIVIVIVIDYTFIIRIAKLHRELTSTMYTKHAKFPIHY